MNLLLLLSHSIEEYDQVELLSGLGYDVFSIGAYTDPAHPGDDKRPPVTTATHHPELAALCDAQRAKHAGEEPGGRIDWAKGDLHPDLIEWADAIIVHHYVEAWIVGNWPAIHRKRVIWRTVGQSNPTLELQMRELHREGLQIVRYSPAEERAFGALGCFAGQDALIRFWKDRDEWSGWNGADVAVGNITQHMAQRGDHCGYPFWASATDGLPTRPAGPGSEVLPNGLGPLDYDAMRDYLRRIRVYLYTGTQPASYTLGLIEAMMTGTPVVSIGPERMWIPALFEGHELAHRWSNDPAVAKDGLRELLNDHDLAYYMGELGRLRAIELFGRETIGRQWSEFLG